MFLEMIGECWRVIFLESSRISCVFFNHFDSVSFSYLQYFATKSSPTEHLLTFWYARQESLLHLINVLNQIGRSDAACLIVTQMNLNH